MIRPLRKKKDLDLELCNYRPVSNPPFLSKVLEKAALNNSTTMLSFITPFMTINLPIENAIPAKLHFQKHITHKYRIAMQNVHQIRNIRSTLTMDAAHTLVLGLIISHLNFYNVLFGLQQKSVHKIQRVQNIAAKLVLNKQKYDSAAESRKLLHWLPIAARNEFKILVLVYKYLQGDAPEYLHNMLT